MLPRCMLVDGTSSEESEFDSSSSETRLFVDLLDSDDRCSCEDDVPLAVFLGSGTFVVE